MAKAKSLQQEIISALRVAGVATREDLKKYPTRQATKKMVTDIVMQASEAIVSAMDRMFENVPTKTEFNQEIKKLQTDVGEIKRDIHFIKDDISKACAFGIKNIESDISMLQIGKKASYV